MPQCPVCQIEFEQTSFGQLCPKCRANVLANDVYSKSDLRFVGILAGVLTAAVASMPGALIGNLIGRAFDMPTRGCTIGVVMFAFAGLIAGYRIAPGIILRMENEKRAK